MSAKGWLKLSALACGAVGIGIALKLPTRPAKALVALPAAQRLPPEAIEGNVLLGDMPIGSEACTFMGFRVESDGSVWIDSRMPAHEASGRCGEGSRVSRTATGYIATVYGRQRASTYPHGQGEVLAEKVVYVP